MQFNKNYEELYSKLSMEQREIVSEKVLAIWRDNDLNGDMIRAIAYKLLISIGFKGGDKFQQLPPKDRRLQLRITN